MDVPSPAGLSFLNLELCAGCERNSGGTPFAENVKTFGHLDSDSLVLYAV
jgi:hypothetical protein